MKKLLTLTMLLFLTACTPEEVALVEVVEEPVEEVVEVAYQAPVMNLDHIDYGIQPTSASLQEMGVCYEIFPISFADSNGDGDGDLAGITAHLPYLEELGIDCIWLTPILESPSYHKYDVTDYLEIDPLFGTKEDFEVLLATSHELGISVLMDLVVNHTSKEHPWFTEHPEYYTLVETGNPDYRMSQYWYKQTGDMNYFAYFWDQMPELNLDSPVVREEIFSIAEYWTEFGVDGFRLDAAKHYFDPNEYPVGTATQEQNILFLKELNARVKAVNPDAVLLSEVWSDASVVSAYYEGVDSSFNFSLGEGIMDSVLGGADTKFVEDLIDYRDTISDIRPDFVDSIFLTNHDQNRVMSVLDSEAKAMLAANIYLTLPGISWIYYGEELGMYGEKPDEMIRQPMIWDDETQTDGIGRYALYGENLEIVPMNDLYEHYKALIAIKNTEIFINGTLTLAEKTQRHFVAYVRSLDEKNYLVVHNLSGVEKELMLSDTFEVIDLLGYEPIVGETIMMEPYSSIILEIPTSEITLTY